MVLNELNIISEDKRKKQLEVIEIKQINEGKDGFILIKNDIQKIKRFIQHNVQAVLNDISRLYL